MILRWLDEDFIAHTLWRVSLFLLHENVPGGNGTGVAFWDCFEGSQALNVGFCGSWELLSFQKGDCGAQFWHYSRAPPLKNEPQGGQNHPWHWTGGTPLCTDGVPNVLGHACGVGVTISRPHCSTWDLGLGFEGCFPSKPSPGSIMRQVQISPCHTREPHWLVLNAISESTFQINCC